MDEEVIPVLRGTPPRAGPPGIRVSSTGGVRLFLSDHTGDARPDTLIYLRLRDLDAIAAGFGAAVEQMPWGPETWLRDPDGNRLRIGMPAS